MNVELNINADKNRGKGYFIAEDVLSVIENRWDSYDVDETGKRLSWYLEFLNICCYPEASSISASSISKNKYDEVSNVKIYKLFMQIGLNSSVDDIFILEDEDIIESKLNILECEVNKLAEIILQIVSMLEANIKVTDSKSSDYWQVNNILEKQLVDVIYRCSALDDGESIAGDDSYVNSNVESIKNDAVIKKSSFWQKSLIWLLVAIVSGWVLWHNSYVQKLPAPSIAKSINYDIGRRLLPPSMNSVSTAFPRARIWLEDDYSVHHSNILYDNGQQKQWVVIYNGEDISYHHIDDEASEVFKSDDKNKAGVYSIYLEQQVDGEFRIISNIVSYNIKSEPVIEQMPNISEKESEEIKKMEHESAVEDTYFKK